MARKEQAGTPALVALAAAGVPHTVHAYEHDPRTPAGYGLEAAAVLGLDPAQVYKTLVAEVDGRLAVAVVPVKKAQHAAPVVGDEEVGADAEAQGQADGKGPQVRQELLEERK